MKLVHSFALVAVFLLVSDSIVPSQAGWWSSSDKKEETKPKNVTHLEMKKEELPQKDDELNQPLVNDLDDDKADYGEEILSAPGSAQSNLAAQTYGIEEPKQKFDIEDDGMGAPIPNISVLPSQNQSVQNAAGTYPYDPAQGEFVEGHGSHPTESRGADPRFERRRECQDGQYLCRKAHPQQEHIRCIPNEWKCNGVRDCEENDDEEGCSINAHRTQPNGCIAPHQYTCYGTGVNGIPAACIDSRKLCDGTYDCSYGDDESQDRCAQYATRRQESVAPAGQPPVDLNGQPQTQPQTQQAPSYNPYPAQQPQQPQPEIRAPQPEPQRPVQQECPPARNEEYVKRLEWIDRCFRSCLKY